MMIDYSKESQTEFDILEQFLDINFKSQRYSKTIINQVVTNLIKLRLREDDERGTK